MSDPRGGYDGLHPETGPGTETLDWHQPIKVARLVLPVLGTPYYAARYATVCLN
jgi:hypothetical protein